MRSGRGLKFVRRIKIDILLGKCLKRSEQYEADYGETEYQGFASVSASPRHQAPD